MSISEVFTLSRAEKCFDLDRLIINFTRKRYCKICFLCLKINIILASGFGPCQAEIRAYPWSWVWKSLLVGLGSSYGDAENWIQDSWVQGKCSSTHYTIPPASQIQIFLNQEFRLFPLFKKDEKVAPKQRNKKKIKMKEMMESKLSLTYD